MLLKTLFFLTTFLLNATALGSQFLTINAINDKQQPVKVNNAYILVSPWNGQDKTFPLVVKNNVIHMPTSAQWLTERWHEWWRYSPEAFLHIDVANYATKRSLPFIWSSPDSSYSTSALSNDIDFVDDQKINVNKNASVTLVFKTPQAKLLTFVDTRGNAIVNMNISAYLMGSTKNHCATMTSSPLLGHFTTNKNGSLYLPGGDFSYVLLTNPIYEFTRPTNAEFPNRFIGKLSKEQTITMKRLASQSFILHVKHNGKSAKNVNIYSENQYCQCGICSGILTTTDKNGVANVDKIYPNLNSSLFMLNSSNRRI